MPDLVADHLASYEPSGEGGFQPRRVVLTRGALDTPPRRAFVERLLARFPDAERVEALDRTHMQLHGLLPAGDAARREAGRRTLVVGTLATPLRLSRERHIVCPNYLHFSPTAYCTYACAYCYLAGSCSTVVAPVAKVYVNLEDALAAIARKARGLREPTSFYVGKLQDALALDPLTGFSRVLVPYFAEQPLARLVLLTKSDCVGNLPGLGHRGRTAVSWSVNPEAVCREFERGAPPLARRLAAARRCQEAGYPIRFLVMPMLPVDGWRRHYAELVEAIFAATSPQRITLGGICSYATALRLTAGALGSDNVIARHIEREPSPDGRRRFPRGLRAELYRHVIAEVRRRAPRLPVGLCLEEPEVWHACGLDPSRPTCNCTW
ncbi:MAG TPA: hypothetical protein VNE39_11150 [Planctomycetota bacterium]|nr:hypothetical protein [Planctomycetota bacterium]